MKTFSKYTLEWYLFLALSLVLLITSLTLLVIALVFVGPVGLIFIAPSFMSIMFVSQVITDRSYFER